MSGINLKEIPDYQAISQRLAQSVMEAKESFMKQKLTEKGYGHLIDEMKQMRFPKIAICTSAHDKWEYIFVDDGSVQGKFIGAMIMAVDIFNPLTPYEAKVGFDWQDTDFSAVRIPEI